MTITGLALLAVLGGMIWLFFTGKLPLELTAFLGLVIVTLLGLISVDEAFAGLSSPAVITLVCLFFVSAALRETGAADSLARQVEKWSGRDELRCIAGVMLLGAFFSAFMSNLAAAALLMPAVVALAGRSGLAPSKLLLPMAFATIWGGMTTLIGTPPNLLAADMLQRAGLKSFQFYDFTALGLLCLAAAFAFMLVWGRRWLPENKAPGMGRDPADLTRIYNLFERVFLVRVAPGSALHGRTLGASHLGSMLGSQVIAILRGNRQLFAPPPEEVLLADDTLVLGGRREDLETLARFKGVKVERAGGLQESSWAAEVVGVTLEVLARGFPGETLGEMEFLSRFKGMVVGIERKGELIFRDLSSFVLKSGDRLQLIAPAAAAQGLAAIPGFKLVKSHLPAFQVLPEHLFQIDIPSGCAAVGLTLGESQLGQLLGLTVIGFVHEGGIDMAFDAHVPLKAGDCLLVVGESRQIARLSALSELELLPAAQPPQLESPEVGLAEVILAPRSRLIGATLKEVSFRERYDFQVLAIWRSGRPVRSRLGRFVLRLGDALLLQGPRRKMNLLSKNADFVMLSESPASNWRRGKALFAWAALLLLVLLPVFKLAPVSMAALMAAVLVVLGGAVTMQEGYREVEWRVVLFVAALLPFGLAFERSGLSRQLAELLGQVGNAWGPYPALIILCLAASLVSQLLDGALAVILLTPVAISSALHLNVSPLPLVMALTLGASIAFLTPFSAKSGLLVAEAGGYGVKDFLKVGAPLSLILFVVVIALTPVFFRF